MITGIMRTEESTKYSKEVVWTIDNPKKRLEEGDTLLRDVISLRDQKWRLLLHVINLLDFRYVNVSLSRVAISNDISVFSSASWHAGILDRDGIWQYDRSGLLSLQTKSSEWIRVADWSGPECRYITQEKDLYMPSDRLTFVLHLHWDLECLQKDSEGAKMNTIDANLKIEDYSHYSKSLFWMIEDPEKRLEESNTLLSEAISFGGQHWRLSLHTLELLDAWYNDVGLSRVTISSEPPSFPSVLWYAGILCADGSYEYDRRGMTRLETAYEQWTPVASWFGPERTYMSLEKDLYMPCDRLTVAVKLRWKPERKKINQIVGRLETGVSTQHFKEIFWKIGDLKRHLEESESLLSKTFTFEMQNWRLLLQKVNLSNVMDIKVSISRINTCGEIVLCTHVWWHVGILDEDGTFHYDCSGWAEQGTQCCEWMTVAECPMAAEWTNLTKKKGLLMPGNRLTVCAVFSCFGPLYQDDKRMDLEKPVSFDSNPKNRYTPGLVCDVVVNVRGTVFRTHRPILEIFSPVMASMLHTRETDGQNEVLDLPDCDPKAFEIFLTFANSGEVDGMTGEVIEEVYYFADRYDVAGLKDECVRRLLTTLSADSV